MVDVDARLLTATVGGVLAVVLVSIVASVLNLSYTGVQIYVGRGLMTSLAIAAIILWRFDRPE